MYIIVVAYRGVLDLPETFKFKKEALIRYEELKKEVDIMEDELTLFWCEAGKESEIIKREV